ncbi:hypothetical protein DFJ77DRAFT_453496 [Powellomyces hirtus]|nr:hypothetical protein DFJ77DRAFT_453496 [Powellomyces hirtus]
MDREVDPSATEETYQNTITSVRAMLATTPQYLSEPTPAGGRDGTSSKPTRSRHASYSSAMSFPQRSDVPRVTDRRSTLSAPRRRRRRPRKIPLWRRFRLLLIRCWSFVCFARSNSSEEHVRVQIRRDHNGRTVVKTRVVNKNTFLAFDDDENGSDEEAQEEVWEEWEPDVSLFGRKVPPATQAVAGGLANTAADVNEEVDNVMHVLAKVLLNLPRELSAQYLFTGLLGYGGNGFVAAALDRRNGTPVAIKFLNKDRISPSSLMFSDSYPYPIPVEAEIIRTVRHPNIVGFYALHRNEQFFMIVMEKVVTFLRDDGESTGLQPLVVIDNPKLEDPATMTARSFDGIPLTQRTHAPIGMTPMEPATTLPRTSLESGRPSFSSLRVPTPGIVDTQRAEYFVSVERNGEVPSVSRPYSTGFITTSFLPTSDLPILFSPSQNPSPQPTLVNLTRPRHGHPGDLDEFLYMYGPLHPLIQRRLSYQLISAYSHLADTCIAYLDFRGENIIVDRGFNIRLVDFGMSQFLDATFDVSGKARQRRPPSTSDQQQAPRFTLYGTRPFSAPEILAGNSYSGPEADMWALGILFYLIATGGIEPFESVDHILKTSTTPLSWPVGCTVLSSQKQLVERMLAHRPQDRPSVREVCACDWFASDNKSQP